uniref:NB-ARC domain-containing protein n=1 Tax=Oryza nivara TaxID=4536 RepID=A0A0E0J4D0_ORYNI
MEIAVGTSSASMEHLLAKLEGLLSQEHALIQHVRGDIQYISDQLAAVRAFLHGHRAAAESSARRRRRDDDEQMKLWVKLTRDLAYNVEDCVDGIRLWLNRVPEPRDGDHGLLSSLRRAWYAISTVYVRRDIAAKISTLKLRVHHLEAPTPTPWCDGASPESYTTAGDILSGRSYTTAGPSASFMGMVGTEQAMGELGPWLTISGVRDSRKILAIVGCRGLGKRTLAAGLRCAAGEEFDCRVSVVASRKLRVEAFLRSLLKQIMPRVAYNDLQIGGMDGWEVRRLKEKVEEQLLDRRYVVVIDDVCSVPSCELILNSLPENQKDSRIVVTTRFHAVAEAIGRLEHGHVYKLNPLSVHDSYLLLLRRTFGSNYQCSSVIDRRTSKILDKCGGVPLALVALAGLLGCKLKSDPNWIRVCDSVNSELEKEHLPDEVTAKIIYLCYEDLPADLKTCMLYLSTFPVGLNISKKRVIRRWISEGFIAEKHGKTAEQVADDCFDQLFKRSMISAVDIGTNGEVKTFQVHEMILEYILRKSNEEGFITVIDEDCPGLMPRSKIRWLSVHGSTNSMRAKEFMKTVSLLHVRSLTSSRTMKQLSSFKILQVLDLEGCEDLTADQLVKICKMYLLKYLSLRRTYMKGLPSVIGRLKYLEILDIRETNVQRLPTSVKCLQRMTHLLCGDKSRHLSLTFTVEIAEMLELQTLSGIEIDTASAEAFAAIHKLTKLKKLSIYNLKVQPQNISRSFEHLLFAILTLTACSLTSLAIDDGFTGFLNELVTLSTFPSYLRALELSGGLNKVPEWIVHLHFLEKLSLSLTSLRTDSLVLISKLPVLFSLTFSVNSARQRPGVLSIHLENVLNSVGEIFVPPNGFSNLHTLRLLAVGLPLQLISFLEGAMPALQRLEVRCRMFEGIYGLETLQNLSQVHLEVSKQASEVAKEKVRQTRSSVSNHPNRPAVIFDEYFE